MIDLSFLEEFTKGNKAKMKRYISLYLSVVPDTFSRMQENVDAGNWADLAIHAHSLKPQADYIGHNDLKNKLVEIELAVKQQNFNACKALLKQAMSHHEEAHAFLAEWLENHEAL